MLGRAPGAVVPAEVAVQERQRRVDAVVGLVPALLAREHGPRLELAQLRVEAGRRRVEQARDAVLGRVAAAAAGADELVVEAAAAGRAADVRRERQEGRS